MRILFVTDFYHPYSGGVEIHVRTIGRELQARGNTVAVATLPSSDRSVADGKHSPADDGGIEVHSVRHSAQAFGARFRHQDRPWAPPFPDPLTCTDLRRVVKRFKPDVIHGHDWLARSALPRIVTGGVPVVTSLHYYTRSCAKKTLWRDNTICDGPELKQCMQCSADHYGRARGTLVTLGLRAGTKLEDRNTKRWISVSEATEVGNGLSGRTNSLVIANPVPSATASAQNGSQRQSTDFLGELDGDVRVDLAPLLEDDDKPFVLFVGDIRPEKGVEVLAAAMRQLQAQGNETPLVIVGERMTSSIDLPDNTIEVGHVDNNVVQQLWRSATVGVIPSQWPEPFGLVAVEAMAAGCPIVASRVGGLAEILADGRADLVEPGDPNALAGAIHRLLDDPERRRQLSTLAKASVDRYAIDSIVDKIERQYQELALN